MYRLVFLLSLLFATAGQAQARKTMREVWVTMPDSIVPYLNHELRVALADYWDMGAEAKVKNLLKNETRLVKMADDYMELRLNGNTDAAIKLLAADDSTYIICMVRTMKAPAEASRVEFYSEGWQALQGSFGLPTDGDADVLKRMFTEAGDSIGAERFDRLCGMIEPVMMSARLSEGDDTIVFGLSLPLLTAKERDEVAPVLRQRKFRWDGKTFKKC